MKLHLAITSILWSDFSNFLLSPSAFLFQDHTHHILGIHRSHRSSQCHDRTQSAWGYTVCSGTWTHSHHKCCWCTLEVEKNTLWLMDMELCWKSFCLFVFFNSSMFFWNCPTHCSQPWHSHQLHQDSLCLHRTSSVEAHTCGSRDTGKPRDCRSWILWRHYGKVTWW